MLQFWDVVNLLLKKESTHGELHFCDCGCKLTKITVSKTAGKCLHADQYGDSKCPKDLNIGEDQVRACTGCPKFYCLACLQTRRTEEVSFTCRSKSRHNIRFIIMFCNLATAHLSVPNTFSTRKQESSSTAKQSFLSNCKHADCFCACCFTTMRCSKRPAE